ncbi:MAG: hypothetical protein ACQGVK_18770 [Myxococcota bacterium]
MDDANATAGGGDWQASSLTDALGLADAELFPPQGGESAEVGLTCPDPQEAPLQKADEDTQVVLGMLWMAFGKGAASMMSELSHPDIKAPALELGTEKMRGFVYDQCVSNGGTGGGWLTVYEERWRKLGARAMERAALDSTTVISRAHFEAAWNDDPPIPPRLPRPLSNALDIATELIGAHLWFRYEIGALFGADLPYDSREGIVRRGRALSRYWVRHNVVKWGVVDGTDIDYGNWNFGLVGECAYKGGRRSNRDARRDGATSISVDHFDSAWCSIHAAMLRVAARAGVSIGTFSGACG